MSRRDKTKEDREGIRLIAFAVVIAVAVGSLVLYRNLQQAPNPQTNCLSKIESSSVIIIDLTDKVALQTKDEIFKRVEDFVQNEVPERGLVSLFYVQAESKTSLRPIVEVCKPPQDGNAAIQDVSQIKKTFNDKFLEPIRVALNAPITNSTESPIAEVIADVAVSHYLKGSEKRIEVFSDLLEYTPSFNLYTCDSPQKAFENYVRTSSRHTTAWGLGKVLVRLHRINRAGHSREQRTCQKGFWDKFFNDLSDGQSEIIPTSDLPG